MEKEVGSPLKVERLIIKEFEKFTRKELIDLSIKKLKRLHLIDTY